MSRIGPVPTILFALFSLFPPRATAEPDPLLERMEQLRSLFRPDPGGYEGIFHPAFLQAVPAEKLTGLIRELHAANGACTDAFLLERKSKVSGVFDLGFEKGVSMPSTLDVESKPPFRVTGWWLGAPAPAAKDLGEIVQKLAALPGKVSFAAVKLGGEEPQLLASLEPDAPLAIGSTFKLYVLGALADAVERGAMRWDEVLPLREDRVSLPSGILQEWPASTPLTLQSLAVLMISMSDNTATDHLLFRAGRDKVESMLGKMGNRNAGRNVPFLSTLEMFKIKCDAAGARAEAWLKLGAEERRKQLEGEIAGLPRGAVDVGVLVEPVRIETIEWFASAMDLVRAMDHLRRQGEKPGLAPVLGVMGVNRGLQVSTKRWSYVGFKGGSEPGVLNLTLLLRSVHGEWFALSAGWNDPRSMLDAVAFTGLVQKALTLLPEKG